MAGIDKRVKKLIEKKDLRHMIVSDTWPILKNINHDVLKSVLIESCGGETTIA